MEAKTGFMILGVAFYCLFLQVRGQIECTFPGDIVGNWDSEKRGSWQIGYHDIAGITLAISGKTEFHCVKEVTPNTYIMRALPMRLYRSYLQRYMCLELKSTEDGLVYTIKTAMDVWLKDRLVGIWQGGSLGADYVSRLCPSDGSGETGKLTKVNTPGLRENSKEDLRRILMEEIRNLAEEDQKTSEK